MTAPELLRDLRRLLGELERPTTNAAIARAVGVTLSTVYRWEEGAVEPRWRKRLALDLLHRAATRAAAGHADGARVLDAFLSTPGLAGLGYYGAAVAAGLGWVLGSGES